MIKKIKENDLCDRLDNSGFSLVELIIVIAIMAILIGIVGSRVLPYIAQAREAKDQQILSGWVTSATAAYATDAADLDDDSYDIVITSNSVTVGGTNGALLEKDFIEMSGVHASSPFDMFSSKLYQEITKITFTVSTESSGGRNAVCICDIRGLTSGTISTSELVAR